MSTNIYDGSTNSRIFNTSMVGQGAGVNSAVTGWVIGDNFVLGACAWQPVSSGGACNKAYDAAAFKLQFSLDGSTGWTDVGPSTAINYASGLFTDDSNDTTQRLGDPSSGGCTTGYTASHYNDGDNTLPDSGTITGGAAETWLELYWHLDTANASYSQIYYFRIVNTTAPANFEALSATITMESSGTTYNLSCNAACTTTTSAIDISITNTLSAAASCTTTTSALVLSITTKLSANAACTTTTSAIDLDIASVVSVSANAACTTATNDNVVLGITTTLAAATAVVTTTGLIDLSITDQLSCSCSTTTSTSSIELFTGYTEHISDSYYNWNSSATWNTVHDSTSGTLVNLGNTLVMYSGDAAGTMYISRFHLLFDFSAETVRTISEAKLEIICATWDGSQTLCIQESTQTSEQAGSYDDFTGSSFGTVTVTGTGTFEITLNAAGIAYLQSKLGSGTAQLCVREYTYDYLDSSSSGQSYLSNDFHGIGAIDYNKPLLTLTYGSGEVNLSANAACSTTTSGPILAVARKLKLNPVVNGDAEDATYADSSSHALVGWTNVGSHDATNKITIE